MQESKLEAAIRAGRRIDLGFEVPRVLILTERRIEDLYDNPYYDQDEERRAIGLSQNERLWNARCDLRDPQNDPASVERTILDVLCELYGDEAKRLLKRAVSMLRDYDGASGWPVEYLAARLGELVAAEADAVSRGEFSKWLEDGTWQRFVPAARIRATVHQLSGREAMWDLRDGQTLEQLVRRVSNRVDNNTRRVLKHRWYERGYGQKLFNALSISERSERDWRKRAVDVLHRAVFSAD